MLVVALAITVFPVLTNSRTAVIKLLISRPCAAFIRRGVRAPGQRVVEGTEPCLGLIVLPAATFVLPAPLGVPEIHFH